MNTTDQTKTKPYDPRQDPSSALNFLIKEQMMLKAKGKTDTREYLDLCKIIEDSLRRYKK